MITIELDEPQAEMLRHVLTSYLSDLRMEIADTDRLDYREGLKSREVFLKDLLGRLSG